MRARSLSPMVLRIASRRFPGNFGSYPAQSESLAPAQCKACLYGSAVLGALADCCPGRSTVLEAGGALLLSDPASVQAKCSVYVATRGVDRTGGHDCRVAVLNVTGQSK